MSFGEFFEKNKILIAIGCIFLLVVVVIGLMFGKKEVSQSNQSEQSAFQKDGNKISNSLILLANSLNTVQKDPDSSELGYVTSGVGNPTPFIRKLTTEELMERSRTIITQWWSSFLNTVPSDMRYQLAGCNSITDMTILQHTIICVVSNLMKKYVNTTGEIKEEDILKLYKNKEQCEILGSIILNFLLSQMITRGFESNIKGDLIIFKIRDVNLSDPNYYETPFTVVMELYKSENSIKIFGSLKEETQNNLSELIQSPGFKEFKELFSSLNVEQKIDVTLFAKFIIYIWMVKFPELDDNCVYCVSPNQM